MKTLQAFLIFSAMVVAVTAGASLSCPDITEAEAATYTAEDLKGFAISCQREAFSLDVRDHLEGGAFAPRSGPSYLLSLKAALYRAYASKQADLTR